MGLACVISSCKRLQEDRIPIDTSQATFLSSGGGNKEKMIKSSPHLAADGLKDSVWFHDNHTSGWIQVDFGKGQEKKVGYLEILPAHPSWGAPGIKNFIFEGSYDGTNWFRVSSGILKKMFVKQNFTVSNDRSFRFYRINIKDSYASHIGIAEIVFFGPYDPEE